MLTVFLLNVAATWALVGLIWIVQIVHYPLFNLIGSERFREYHARHTRTITWIVAPLMFTEVVTAAMLVLGRIWDPWLLASYPLLAFNWLSTWLIQVPQHQQLSEGYDQEVWRKLVRLNWLRTAAWSLRGVCVLVALYHHLSETTPA